MELYRSGRKIFPPTARAVSLIFLIALSACKDRSAGLLAQPSESPAVSIATPAPQTKPHAAPTPYPPNAKYKPKEEYVPDAATAIKIAEAVWTLKENRR
ncbi:MAG: hypothetical protein J2P21_10950 [Chloracidobacterium sp.]|nr:hypothetical protein [Chloracidobacterium sp.]